MCATCGCSDGATPSVTNLQTGERLGVSAPVHHHSHSRAGHDHDDDHDHDHDHNHDHDHDHDHDHGGHRATASPPRPATPSEPHSSDEKRFRLEQQVLARNDLLAERNRGWLAGRRAVAVNLVSAPGAGKTTLLERTIRELGEELSIHVIEGDQATVRDAERIQSAGAPVVQINTGTGCHLDAEMAARGLEQLDPPMRSLVLIENVGNLVCPALFDLGERCKVLVASVTDGDDKPLKYPHMFRAAELVLLNKIDLLPHVPFDLDKFLEGVRLVNPQARVLRLSAIHGEGLSEWYGWLRALRIA